MIKLWYKLIYRITYNHVSEVFESGILFKIFSKLIPAILGDFKPLIHDRLSFLLGKIIRVDTPYFMACRTYSAYTDFLTHLKV